MMDQIKNRNNQNRMDAINQLSNKLAMKKNKPQLNTFQRDFFARYGSKNPKFTSKDVASRANIPGNTQNPSNEWSEITSLPVPMKTRKSSSKTKKKHPSIPKKKKHPPIPKKKKHLPIPKKKSKSKSSSKTKKQKQGVDIAQLLGDNPNFKKRKKAANRSSSVDVSSSSFNSSS